MFQVSDIGAWLRYVTSSKLFTSLRIQIVHPVEPVAQVLTPPGTQISDCTAQLCRASCQATDTKGRTTSSWSGHSRLITSIVPSNISLYPSGFKCNPGDSLSVHGLGSMFQTDHHSVRCLMSCFSRRPYFQLVAGHVSTQP